MNNANETNKNTAQFFMLGIQADGTMGAFNSGNYDETLQCASEVCRRGYLELGINILKKLAVLRPDDPAPAKELVFALILNHESEDALPYINVLTRLWPDLAITAALQGKASKTLGNTLEASQCLEKSLSAKFTDIDSFRAVVGLAMLLGQHIPEAEALVHEIQKIAPDDPFAWLALGNIYRLQGKTSKAEGALKQAILIAPHSKQGQIASNLLMEMKARQGSDFSRN